MKIIIDTHIFLWAISKPSRISEKKRQEIERLSNIIYVSAVSITELMIKSSIGKLQMDFNPIVIAEKSGFELLDFSAEDALALKEMPFYHRDPFDRMLISQAINRKFYLMSEDHKFGQYDCRIL